MNELRARFAAIVGERHVLTRDDEVAPFVTDWRRRYTGKPLAVVRPASTQEVAAVVRLCAETRTPIVPQAGNTGLVGGATPDGTGREVVLSLVRLDRIRAVDARNDTMTAEAGCTLAAVQDAARLHGRIFPLDLPAAAACCIGGNLATNAGGNAVLRYGTARALALGLEVVLPDGEVWDGLRGLRKDTGGYDLKQLFIGSEGTLGIITAAVLALAPKPSATVTALAGLAGLEDAITLLSLVRERCGERLVGFEVFSHACLALVREHFPALPAPFAMPRGEYALLELADVSDAAQLRERVENTLALAIHRGVVHDLVVASSEAQSRALWALRDNLSDAQTRAGGNIKHDVSVPVSTLAQFASDAAAALERVYPGVRPIVFGHAGDGNLHYNVAGPVSTDPRAWLAHTDAVNRIVHDAAVRFGGSISAEHGVGQARRAELARYRSPLELALMRKVKAALDPLGIMNPGKVI
jgi:D-lactate dehydrogenase (cytochrome)